MLDDLETISPPSTPAVLFIKLTHQLHRVIHTPHSRAHHQPRWRIQHKLRIIYNRVCRQLRMHDSRLQTALVRVTGAHSALRSAQSRRDHDMVQELSRLLLVQTVGYGFR